MRKKTLFVLEQRYADEIVAHAREEVPNECCGILAGSAGRVAKLFRGINSEKSPVRYNIAPHQLLEIHKELEERGWEILGIYHSHTHTQAYPSATDVRLAFWPGSLYIIVSLENAGRPAIRAFTIKDEKIEEQDVVIR